MSDDNIAFLLWRRDFLLDQLIKSRPESAPIHYRSLLSQLDEVEHELGIAPLPTRRLESGIPPKYWRVLGWFALGFCCLVGVVNVLN